MKTKAQLSMKTGKHTYKDSHWLSVSGLFDYGLLVAVSEQRFWPLHKHNDAKPGNLTLKIRHQEAAYD